MATTYIHLASGRHCTEAVLNGMGVSDLSEENLVRSGIASVSYATPAYDSALCTLEPQKDLVQVDEYHFRQDFDIVPLPIEQARENMKARATAKRWEVETGGITLPNGARVLTGIDDQNRVATSVQGMTAAGLDAIDFKAAGVWVKLSLAELKAISVAVTAHVEACFARERALHELCDAADSVADLREIAECEINTGWPGAAA